MSEYIRITRIPVFLLVIFVLAFPNPAAPRSETKPNIVLVLMDNFGYGEVGVYGGGVLRGAATPRIDSIAAEGIQLTNYNVEAECTPSRAALMTGRYGARTRLRPEGRPPKKPMVRHFQVGDYTAGDALGFRLCDGHVRKMALG